MDFLTLCDYSILLQTRLSYLMGIYQLTEALQEQLTEPQRLAMGFSDHCTLGAHTRQTGTHWHITFDPQLPMAWSDATALALVQEQQRQYQMPLDHSVHQLHQPPRQSIGCFLFTKAPTPLPMRFNQSWGILATMQPFDALTTPHFHETSGGIKAFMGASLINQLNAQWQLIHYHQGQLYQVLLIDPELLPQFNTRTQFARQTLWRLSMTANYHPVDTLAISQALLDFNLDPLAQSITKSPLPTLLARPDWFDPFEIAQRFGFDAHHIAYFLDQKHTQQPSLLSRQIGWGFLDRQVNAFEWRLLGQIPCFFNLINPFFFQAPEPSFYQTYADIMQTFDEQPLQTLTQLTSFYQHLYPNQCPKSFSFFINRQHPTLPVLSLSPQINRATLGPSIQTFFNTIDPSLSFT